MNPEDLRALLQAIEEDRAKGTSNSDIDSMLKRRHDLPFNSVRAVRAAVQDLGRQEARERIKQARAEGRDITKEDFEGTRRPAGRVASPLLQGITGGFAFDIFSGLEKLGIAREGTAERFRGDLGEARERAPVISTIAQGAGLLTGPGKAALKGTVKGVRAAGDLAARGGSRLAQAAGVGPLGQIGAGIAARGVGAAGTGTVIGGAESGLLAFGEAAGKPVGERVEASKGPALLGALISGPLAGIGAGVRGIRELNRAIKGRGEELADLTEQVGRRLPSRRAVAGRVDEAKAARSAAFQQAEAAGQNIPVEVTTVLAENSLAQKALRTIANKGGPEAIIFLDKVKRLDLTRKLLVARNKGASAKKIAKLERQLEAAGGAAELTPGGFIRVS